ncbi:MAG TPA: phage portal protein [Stellaceae bacterium]|nr:phage portal protein [Stellaceae bacterium]
MPDLSLAAGVAALDPYRVVMRSGGAASGSGADWFGPQAPLAPIAPKAVAGRRFDYPPGFNLLTQPRAYEPIGFFELRALADGYDLLRIVIETRKDQVARLEWRIRPRRQATTAPDDPRIARIEAFFARPDGVHAWDAWLRELLEDLFVIDAPTLWAERTRGGALRRLHPLDGATMKRVIDDWGRTPEAPLPAYQQVLHGMPAVDYTTRDIIYRPRNTRVHKVYGFSPVEQIIVTVNIALRRQVHQLQYYTEGNIPEALIGTPDTWTPEQIERFQLYWDSINAGNTAERRHAKFVPGGVAKTFLPTKEPDLTGATDEWLARLVCYAFSVSAQPFVRMMNRATAAEAQDEALAEGLVPIRQWVKCLIDAIIADEFAEPDLEFAWKDDLPADPAAAATIAADYVKAGIKSVNEVRAELGLHPVPGGDQPMVLTGQGPVGWDAVGASAAAKRSRETIP